MLGHIGLYVDHLKESDDFYRTLLKVLGFEVIFEVPQCVAYGKNGDPYFEIYTGKPKSSPIHIAFRAGSRDQVDEFHRIGLTLGAKDNGAPGVRKWEWFEYYACFIIDPNGHNLEALF